MPRPAHQRLSYVSIGSEGDPWPQSIRDLRTSSGAYVIKQHGADGTVVYVGSSEGRLYDTVTRHFQQWKRKKQWWKGLRGEGHDPGMTYPRGRHCVGVIVTSKPGAKVLEANLIAKLRPRDNLVARPDGGDDVIPF